MIVLPISQLLLFGYGINTNPRFLPTAVVIEDHSIYSRSIVSAMENSRYFRITGGALSATVAEKLLETGAVMFALTIPDGFARDLVRGEIPHLLLQVDASDPIASANAVHALLEMRFTALVNDLNELRSPNAAGDPPFDVTVHNLYNPESTTQFYIVPGEIGAILTTTMLLVTALGMTRETERGTIESLLATPLKPFEIMTGKISPYLLTGLMQAGVMLAASLALFHVPLEGSLLLLFSSLVIFILANLCVGFTLSTFAHTQLQAAQLVIFFYLPSILLTGFMFPFHGMPEWAQYFGEILPLTHFIRIVRSIMLKGSGFSEMAHELWALTAFLLVSVLVAVYRFRRIS